MVFHGFLLITCPRRLAYLIGSGLSGSKSGLAPEVFYQPTSSGRKALLLVTV